MATFVLVHGAWHGGWCWSRVVDRLTARGHKVYAPTLTGLAERSHLLSRDITLNTHIADVTNLMTWEDLSNVVLVGHSYGGWVISGVAEQAASRLASIVFVDAFMPQDGERALDMQAPPDRAATEAAWDRGELSRPAPPIAHFGIANDADRDWALSRVTPQPIGNAFTRIALTGARDRVPTKAYIRARGAVRPMFDAYYDKLRGDPSWRLYDVPCGHDVMIDMPDRLTEIVLENA